MIKEDPPQVFIAHDSQLQTKTVGSEPGNFSRWSSAKRTKNRTTVGEGARYRRRSRSPRGGRVVRRGGPSSLRRAHQLAVAASWRGIANRLRWRPPLAGCSRRALATADAG